ncbi:MAG: lycopene cyclase family protein [Alphaproteobacteria bacterium]|nr:lycopene cyclase family protein [Alphaproteobacteria bacterium]
MIHDVLIAGAGPAGLSLAAACVARGLRTAVVAPDPDARWAPTYASWIDELPAEVPLAATWERVFVRLGSRSRPLERAYGRVDGDALRERLWASASGVDVLRGTVVATGPAGTSARDDRGRALPARVVVRATGAPSATTWQTAFGWIAELDGLDPAVPLWMDWSFDPNDREPAPSFLYALPFPDGTWLVEETALVRGPAVGLDVLERRLRLRLAATGVRVQHVHATERCTIAMDAEPPPDLAFGAAAGMTHPATGYLLPRVLHAAPRVADALAKGLEQSPEVATRAARDAIWPGDALRRHRILRFASGALARMSARDTRAFLDAFFDQPEPFVRGFLGDALPTGALVQGMAALFTRLSPTLQLRVMAGGDPTELFRAAAATRAPSLEATP